MCLYELVCFHVSMCLGLNCSVKEKAEFRRGRKVLLSQWHVSSYGGASETVNTKTVSTI